MKRVHPLIPIVALVTIFGLLMRVIFGLSFVSNLYQVMSLSFIMLVPAAMGALTIALSHREKVRSLRYRIFTPWLPILALFVLTVVVAIEGWACWLMVLPFFLIAASLGGLLAGYFKLKRRQNERTYISLIALLPLVLSPMERWIGSIPGRYEAYTYIDIHGPRQTIWENVTRVRAIPREQDKGWLTRTLGFPRPVRAELNYNGVGAHREAFFTNGLVFHEQVYYYEDQKRMDFTIKAYPYEIPSTTMDKHIVIGGDYFDVLNGTYILQPIDSGTYRLHLYSHFKLTTTFNFYASLWAAWIMKDIQNNILQVIKQRTETATSTS